MEEIVKFDSVEDYIIELRGEKVILDCNVAVLYGVETREINQAVRNNPDKFPKGYIIEIDKSELSALRSKILILKTGGRGEHSKYPPKAFTEKGLYMLATILKGERATRTAIAIIEAFAKLRELTRTIGEMAASPDKFRQKSLMQKSGEIMADLFGEDMKTDETETEIEVNFAVLKLKNTIKRKGQK